MIESDIRTEYDSINHEFKLFLEEIERIIASEIEDRKLTLAFPIETRVKALNSIIDKSKRSQLSGGFKLKKSITELNDLAGMRIVVLYPHEKTLVAGLLQSLMHKVSMKEVGSNQVTTFNYTSIHLQCKIPQSWLGSPNWTKHENKEVEIQIRTLSEHIWAKTSHDLFYKSENVPAELARELHKIKALLEITDEKLQDLKEKTLKHWDFAKTAPYEKVLTMDIHQGSVRRILTKYYNKMEVVSDDFYQEAAIILEKEYNINTTVMLDQIASQMQGPWVDEQEFWNDFLLACLLPINLAILK